MLSGSSISKAIESQSVFTPLVVSTVKIGEESGTLGEVLYNMSILYKEESEAQIQTATAMVEPAITLFLLAVVGFVVISIIQPMFGVYSLMNKH